VPVRRCAGPSGRRADPAIQILELRVDTVEAGVVLDKLGLDPVEAGVVLEELGLDPVHSRLDRDESELVPVEARFDRVEAGVVALQVFRVRSNTLAHHLELVSNALEPDLDSRKATLEGVEAVIHTPEPFAKELDELPVLALGHGTESTARARTRPCRSGTAVQGSRSVSDMKRSTRRAV
jgi:hypothetical protein